MEMVQTLTGYVGQWVAGHAPDAWHWRGEPGRLGDAVSYTHLRAHETVPDLVCRLLLEKKKKQKND